MSMPFCTVKATILSLAAVAFVWAPSSTYAQVRISQIEWKPFPPSQPIAKPAKIRAKRKPKRRAAPVVTAAATSEKVIAPARKRAAPVPVIQKTGGTQETGTAAARERVGVRIAQTDQNSSAGADGEGTDVIFLDWDLTKDPFKDAVCDEKNKPDQYDKGECKKNRATQLQEKLIKIGCLSGNSGSSADGIWGENSSSAFKAFLNSSGIDYDFDNGDNNVKLEEMLRYMDLYGASSYALENQGRTATEFRKNYKVSGDELCSKTPRITKRYELWDLTRPRQKTPKSLTGDSDSEHVETEPVIQESVGLILNDLKDLGCVKNKDGERLREAEWPSMRDELTSKWDQRAADAFDLFLESAGAKDRKSTLSYDPKKDTLARVVGYLMKIHAKTFCDEGVKPVEWELDTANKPFKDDIKARQARELQQGLIESGCLKPENKKKRIRYGENGNGHWDQDSAEAIKRFLKKKDDEYRAKSDDEKKKYLTKTLKYGELKSSLADAKASTSQPYICDVPEDYLRTCSNDMVIATSVDTSTQSTGNGASKKVWTDLAGILKDAKSDFDVRVCAKSNSGFDKCLEGLKAEATKNKKNLEARRSEDAAASKGDLAPWKKIDLTDAQWKLGKTLIELEKNMIRVSWLLSVREASSDCGRCRLVRAYSYLHKYAEFVAPKSTRSDRELYRPSKYEDDGNSKQPKIKLSEINLSMLEHAFPIIVHWNQKWQEYMDSVRMHRISERKYREAMTVLEAVIGQLDYARKNLDPAGGGNKDVVLDDLLAWHKDACSAVEKVQKKVEKEWADASFESLGVFNTSAETAGNQNSSASSGN